MSAVSIAVLVAFAVALAVDLLLLARVVRRGGLDSRTAYLLAYIGGILGTPLISRLAVPDASLAFALGTGTLLIGPFFCFAWRFNLWRALRERR